MTIRTTILGALMGAALLATPAAAQQVFSWDYDTAPTLGPFPMVGYATTDSGGGVSGSQALPGFGTSFFHNATSGLSTLTLTGLGAHTSLTLSFDVAFIDTWDGNDVAICCNPDYLFVTRDGNPLLTLSSNNQQGLFPDYQGGVEYGRDLYYRDPDPSGDTNTYTDVVVHFTGLTFAHTGSTFTLGFQAGGVGWQGDGNPLDESWGVDNIVVNAGTGVVPEPAAWGLMLLGFGGVGAVLRRRRWVEQALS